MDLRNLGSSDLKVPVVCLGTMTFGEQNSGEGVGLDAGQPVLQHPSEELTLQFPLHQ